MVLFLSNGCISRVWQANYEASCDMESFSPFNMPILYVLKFWPRAVCIFLFYQCWSLVFLCNEQRRLCYRFISGFNRKTKNKRSGVCVSINGKELLNLSLAHCTFLFHEYIKFPCWLHFIGYVWHCAQHSLVW